MRNFFFVCCLLSFSVHAREISESVVNLKVHLSKDTLQCFLRSYYDVDPKFYSTLEVPELSKHTRLNHFVAFRNKFVLYGDHCAYQRDERDVDAKLTVVLEELRELVDDFSCKRSLQETATIELEGRVFKSKKAITLASRSRRDC